jgi:hypothetical protein
LLKKCQKFAPNIAPDEQAVTDLFTFAVDVRASQLNSKYSLCDGRYHEKGPATREHHLLSKPRRYAEKTPFDFINGMVNGPSFAVVAEDKLGNYHDFRNGTFEMREVFRAPVVDMFGQLFANPDEKVDKATDMYELLFKRTFKDIGRRRIDVNSRWASWYFGALKAAGTVYAACIRGEAYLFLKHGADSRLMELSKLPLSKEGDVIFMNLIAGVAKGTSFARPLPESSALAVQKRLSGTDYGEYFNWKDLINKNIASHVGEHHLAIFGNQLQPPSNPDSVLIVDSTHQHHAEASLCLASLLDLMTATLEGDLDWKAVKESCKCFQIKVENENIVPNVLSQNMPNVVDCLILLATLKLDVELKAKVLRLLNEMCKGHSDVATTVRENLVYVLFLPRPPPHLDPQGAGAGLEDSKYAYIRQELDTEICLHSFKVTMATLDLVISTFIQTKTDEHTGVKHYVAQQMNQIDPELFSCVTDSICNYLEEIFHGWEHRMYADDNEKWTIRRTVLRVYKAFIVDLDTSEVRPTSANTFNVGPDPGAHSLRFKMITRLIGGGPTFLRQRATLLRPHTTMLFIADMLREAAEKHGFGLALAPADQRKAILEALQILDALKGLEEPFLSAAGVDGLSVATLLMQTQRPTLAQQVDRERQSDGNATQRIYASHLFSFLRPGYSREMAWLSLNLLKAFAKSNLTDLYVALRSDFTEESYRREIITSITTHLSGSIIGFTNGPYDSTRLEWDLGRAIIQLIEQCIRAQHDDVGLAHLLLGFHPTNEYDNMPKSDSRQKRGLVLRTSYTAPLEIVLQALTPKIPSDENLELSEMCQHIIFRMCRQIERRKQASRWTLNRLFDQNPQDLHAICQSARKHPMAQLGWYLHSIALCIHSNVDVDVSPKETVFHSHFLQLLDIPFAVEQNDGIRNGMDAEELHGPMGGMQNNHVLYSKDRADAQNHGITNVDLLAIVNAALVPILVDGCWQYDIRSVRRSVLVVALDDAQFAAGTKAGPSNRELDGLQRFLELWNDERKTDHDKEIFFDGWCQALLMAVTNATVDKRLLVETTHCFLAALAKLAAIAPEKGFRAVPRQHHKLAETISLVTSKLLSGLEDWRQQDATFKDGDDVTRRLTWEGLAEIFEQISSAVLLTEWWSGNRQVGDEHNEQAAYSAREEYYTTYMYLIKIAEMMENITNKKSDLSDPQLQAMNLATYTTENSAFILWRHVQYHLNIRAGETGIKSRSGSAAGADEEDDAIHRNPRELDSNLGVGGGGERRVARFAATASLDDIDLRRKTFDAQTLSRFKAAVAGTGGLAHELGPLLNNAECDQSTLAWIEQLYVAGAGNVPASENTGATTAEKSSDQLMRMVCYDGLQGRGPRALRVLAEMIRLETQWSADATSRWIGYLSAHNQIRLLVDTVVNSDELLRRSSQHAPDHLVMNLHEARMNVLLRVAATTTGADLLARVETMRLLARLSFITEPHPEQTIQPDEPSDMHNHAFSTLVSPVIRLLSVVMQSTKRNGGVNRQDVIRQVVEFVKDMREYFVLVLARPTKARSYLTISDLHEVQLVVALLHQLTEADASRLATLILGHHYTELMKQVIELCGFLGNRHSFEGKMLVLDDFDYWQQLDEFATEEPQVLHTRRHVTLPLMADVVGCVRAVMLPTPVGGSGLPTLNDCRVLFRPQRGPSRVQTVFGVNVVFDDVIEVIKHAQHALAEEKELFTPPESWPNQAAVAKTFQTFADEARRRPAEEQPRPFVGGLWSMMKGEIAAAAQRK